MPGLLDLFTGGGEQAAPAPGMTPEEQAQQDAFARNARLAQFGQLGAVLFAAGQKQMPSERAASLQNLGPALASYNEQMKNQQKAQLEALQVAKARQELVRDRQFREMLPKYADALAKHYPDLPREMIYSMPKETIISMVQNAMLETPEKQAQTKLSIRKALEEINKIRAEQGLPALSDAEIKNPTMPSFQSQATAVGAGLPGSPKELREAMAKKAVDLEEEAVKSATAAAEFQPLLDQAVAAYEKAARLNAVGPYTASLPGRAIGTLLNTEAERARQDYDIALKGIEARIVAAQNKGEGSVSNFERQMYANQFPSLNKLNPAEQIKYLKQIQNLTNETIAIGKRSPLAAGSAVLRMNRASVFGREDKDQTPAWAR